MTEEHRDPGLMTEEHRDPGRQGHHSLHLSSSGLSVLTLPSKCPSQRKCNQQLWPILHWGAIVGHSASLWLFLTTPFQALPPKINQTHLQLLITCLLFHYTFYTCFGKIVTWGKLTVRVIQGWQILKCPRNFFLWEEYIWKSLKISSHKGVFWGQRHEEKKVGVKIV